VGKAMWGGCKEGKQDSWFDKEAICSFKSSKLQNFVQKFHQAAFGILYSSLVAFLEAGY